MSDDVILGDIAAGLPEVLVDVRQNQDAVIDMPINTVVQNMIVIAATNHDTVTDGWILECMSRRVKIIVVFNQVIDDGGIRLRRIRFRVERIRSDPRHIIPPDRIADHQITSRVRTRITQRVIFGDYIRDDRIAWMAVADIKTRIGLSYREIMVKLASV